MYTLRLLFLVPLSILCLQSTAQVEDLMRDKNITWMVESYNDFLTDERAAEKIGKEVSRVRTLKFLNLTEEYVSDELALQNYILEAVKKGEIVMYKDANCAIVHPIDDLVRLDTSQNCFNINPFAPSFFVYKIYPEGEDVYFFRARQVLYYNSKTVQFGLRTIAIAPMKRETNEAGEIVAWKPLFWMKVTDLSKKHNLSDDAVIWAKQMNLRDGVALKADSVKVLKQINDSVPIAPLFQAFLTKPKIPFYKPDSLWARYSLNERQKLFIQRDTITCAGGDAVLEPKIINRDIHASDIVGLRLLQNWYWNDKKKRLEIYLVATAPLKDIKNEADEFLFRQALFYRRTDD